MDIETVDEYWKRWRDLYRAGYSQEENDAWFLYDMARTAYIKATGVPYFSPNHPSRKEQDHGHGNS